MTIKPGRDVIAPHRDVLEGTFEEAMFAADLTQVVAGTAVPEYQDPQLFSNELITSWPHIIDESRRPGHRGKQTRLQLDWP